MAMTPGPWERRRRNDGGACQIVRKRKPDETDFQMVALIDRPDWNDDARAIAALPDLIEACDFALTILEGMGNGNGDAAYACRAALAKAKP